MRTQTLKCKTRTGCYIFNLRPGIGLEFRIQDLYIPSLEFATGLKPHVSFSTRKRCTSPIRERDNSRVPQSHRYRRTRLLTHTCGRRHLYDKCKIAAHPGKQPIASITKSRVF